MSGLSIAEWDERVGGLSIVIYIWWEDTHPTRTWPTQNRNADTQLELNLVRNSWIQYFVWGSFVRGGRRQVVGVWRHVVVNWRAKPARMLTDAPLSVGGICMKVELEKRQPPLSTLVVAGVPTSQTWRGITPYVLFLHECNSYIKPKNRHILKVIRIH